MTKQITNTISIIVTSYNHAKFIAECLNSIKEQTFPDFEVIVIDDCSTDNSPEIIQNCISGDERFQFIQNEQNMGLAKTLKKSLNYVHGDWVAFLECDDYWDKNHLEILMPQIQKQGKNCGIIINRCKMATDENDNEYKTNKKIEIFEKEIEHSTNLLRYNLKKPTNINWKLRKSNIFPSFSTTTIKKDLLLSLNFDTPIDRSLDWWLWGQATYKHNALFVDDCITHWRIYSSSYTSTTNISDEQEKDFRNKLIKLIKKQDKLYWIYQLIKRLIFNKKYTEKNELLISILDFIKISIYEKFTYISLKIPNFFNRQT